jgi:hypothetical protein
MMRAYDKVTFGHLGIWSSRHLVIWSLDWNIQWPIQ